VPCKRVNKVWASTKAKRSMDDPAPALPVKLGLFPQRRLFNVIPVMGED
jgi:hypothetical protein